MNNDMALTVKISAQDDGAVATVGELDARLSALERAYVSSAGATKEHAAATEAATAATQKETGALAELAAGLEGVSSHSRTVAMGLNALGLEAEAGAAKVEGLVGVLHGLAGAVPELLALGVAIATVAAGFDFIKDAIKDAAELQTQMRAIGTALTNNGESWDEAREKVEQFIESEGRFTGFAEGELRQAFQTIVAAGHDSSDAMQIMVVAEDTARATGMDLTEVVRRITEAEAGRATGLARLDPRLKDLIRNHADLATILTQLERDMKNQTAGTDDYNVAVGRLSNAWEEFREDVGSWLLPWLTSVIDMMTHLVDTVHNVVSALGSLAHSSADALGAAAAAEAGDAETATALSNKATKESSSGWDLFFHASSRAHQYENENRYLAEQRRRHILENGVHLDQNPVVGNQRGGGGAGSAAHDSYSHTSFTPADDAVPKVDALAEAQRHLDEQLKDLGTTVPDLTQKQHLLTAAIDENVATAGNLNREYRDSVSSYEQARAAYNAYGEALNNGTPPTVAQQNHLAELKDRMDKARASMDGLNRSINENASDYERNHDALVRVNEELKKQEDLAKKAAGAWDAFLGKERERMTESLETFQATNAQKVAIYQRLLSQLDAADKDYEKQREALQKKLDDALIGATEDRIKAQQDAEKKFTDEVTRVESTFLDDVLSKHKSLRDSLKDVFNDILGDWAKMIEQMILKTELFKSIGPMIQSAMLSMGLGAATVGGAGGFGGGSSVTSAVEQYGIAGLLGPQAGQQAGISAVALAQNAGAAGMIFGPSAAQQAANAVAAGFPSASAADYSYFGDPYSAAGNNISIPHATSLGGALSGGMLGMALTGKPGGAVGGALGGLLAVALHANPLIGAGIELATSLIGGSIGPHWGPATNYPDRSDPNFGQWLANYQGGEGLNVNGQSVNAQTQYDPRYGGTGINTTLENWALSMKGNASGLNPAQQDVLKQIMGLLNGSTSPGALGVANEHDGTFTLTSGAKISVTDMEALVSKYQAAVGSNPLQSSALFQITRQYPDLNIGHMSQIGTYTPTPVNVTPGAAPAGGGIGGSAQIVINTGGGSIIGGTPQQIADALAPYIATAQGRLATGALPGSSTAYGSTNRYIGRA